MPFSCHSHSGQFCKHAYCSLEEIVQRAIEMKFTHYGLTEHMPSYGYPDPYDDQSQEIPNDPISTFKRYVTEGRKLQEKYKDTLNITVGMETDLIDSTFLDKIKELKSLFLLDYLVGSVHHVNGIPIDFSLEKYLDAERSCGGTENLMTAYYNQQYTLMAQLKPEVVGHFDLISIHKPYFELTKPVWDKIRRNIEFGVSYGALFEVNTSGMSVSRERGYPYPNPDILKELVSHGAKITISDDSHGTDDVGWCYTSLPSYLASNGVDALYYLESCINDDGQIVPGKVTCKKLENFMEHPFWKSAKLEKDV